MNHKQSRSFLRSIDNLLTQAVKDPTRNRVLLELILRKRENLAVDVMAGGNLGCNGHEIVDCLRLKS